MSTSTKDKAFKVLAYDEKDKLIAEYLFAKLKEAILEFRPEIVMHLAAQALVRESYKNPADTFSTNVMGSLNLLESIKACDSVSALVYYINFFSSLFGSNETIPIVLSIWLPHLILFLICLLGGVKINEN